MVMKRMKDHSYEIDVTFTVSCVSAKNLTEAKQIGPREAIKWGQNQKYKSKKNIEINS